MNKSETLNQIGEIRNDLFNKVALSLSQVEGKMNFLNGESFDGEKFISEGHSQVVGLQVQEQVSEIRKELDKLFVKLTETKDSILFS
jgi:uncharacterized protein YjbJ (UPF0337 family)